jgi:hypothetical protein
MEPEVNRLAEALRAAFPDVAVTLESPPALPDGVWWIDVKIGRRHVAVECSPTRGFGLHITESDGYGERPDEVLTTFEEARARLLHVIAAIRLAALEGATGQSPRSPQ